MNSIGYHAAWRLDCAPNDTRAGLLTDRLLGSQQLKPWTIRRERLESSSSTLHLQQQCDQVPLNSSQRQIETIGGKLPNVDASTTSLGY